MFASWFRNGNSRNGGDLEAVNVMGTNYWVPLIVIDLVAPAFLTYGIYKAFKKLSFIKNGDLKLERL